MKVMVIFIIAALVWYGLGVSGFVYWWTKDHDLDVGDAIFGSITGIVGPFTWGIGWLVHGDKPVWGSKTLISKRS